MPLYLIAPAAAGEARKSISCFPASGCFAPTGIPAEKIVICCSEAGSGPMPSTGFSSLIC
jgi:hypothetical protein